MLKFGKYKQIQISNGQFTFELYQMFTGPASKIHLPGGALLSGIKAAYKGIKEMRVPIWAQATVLDLSKLSLP